MLHVDCDPDYQFIPSLHVSNDTFSNVCTVNNNNNNNNMNFFHLYKHQYASGCNSQDVCTRNHIDNQIIKN